MNKIIPSVIQDNEEYYIHMEEYKKVKELGEHYKHLYSEVKKQKDDVVEYIKHGKELIQHDKDYDVGYAFLTNADEILRMLGEIDE